MKSPYDTSECRCNEERRPRTKNSIHRRRIALLPPQSGGNQLVLASIPSSIQVAWDRTLHHVLIGLNTGVSMMVGSAKK